MIARGLDQQDDVVLNAFRAINLSGAPEEVKREAYYKVVAAATCGTRSRPALLGLTAQ